MKTPTITLKATRLRLRGKRELKAGLIASCTLRERQYIESLISDCGGRRTFRMRQCFKNAQRLILADREKRLRYWEGLLDDSIPHAWVTIHGKVVDVTLRESASEYGYLGVPIDRRTVRSHVLLGDDWWSVLEWHPGRGPVKMLDELLSDPRRLERLLLLKAGR